MFGEMGLGDENDDWFVEVSDLNPSHIRLRHRATGSFLHSHDQALPAALGSSLQEVTGFSVVSDPNNDWIVETESDALGEPSSAEIRFTVGGTAIEERIVSYTDFKVWKKRLEELILAERHEWEWVQVLLRNSQGQQPTNPNLEGIGRTAQQCAQSIQELLNQLLECEKRFDTDAFQGAVTSLNELLARTFSERKTFRHSRDPEVAPVLRMSADRPIEAAFYLGTLLKVSPRIQTPEAVHGAYYALAAAEGTSAIRAEADRAAVEEAIRQIQAAAQTQAEDLDRSRAEADRLVAKLTTDAQGFAADCRIAVSEAKSRFDNLTQAMEAKVALNASVQYLDDRRVKCKDAAEASLYYFLGAAIVSILLLTFVIRWQFASQVLTSATEGEVRMADSATNAPRGPFDDFRTFVLGVPNPGTPPAVPYLVTLSVAALAFWVCKVFAKQWIGNLHASADAEERITMLKTYLALISDGTLNSKDDLRLVLSAIFRPGNTGLLEEQGNFQTPIEFVLKRATQGGSSSGNSPT